MNKPIQTGRISAIYPERCTARVYFEDLDNTSRELPIVGRGSQNTKDYWMPTVGEQAICLFLSDKSREGFIIGTFFSDQDKPPVADKNKRHFKFEDGTTIEYDSKTKTLAIDCKGPITIKALGNITVSGDVVADGISLKNHTHSGVYGETSSPN